MSGGAFLGWAVSGLSALGLGLAWIDPGQLPGASTFLFWIVLLLAAEVLPVSLGFQTRVTMSFPITIAIAVLFEPATAMTIAVVGAFDARELKGEIPLWRSLFNRSQLVLAVGGASLLVHAATPSELWSFPEGAIVLIGAIVVHLLINLGLVAFMLNQDRGLAVGEALQILLPKPVTGFLLSQAALGAMGIATAAAYREIQFFVAAFLIPLLFARLSLLGARAQEELAQQVQRQQRSLLDATEKVFEDREQERNRIAGNIHDSSLQLLVGAGYAAGNSLRYMQEGRLADAEAALTTAKGAIEDAIADLRLSLTDLRRSSIEEGGLMATIEAFADQMRVLWSADIQIEGGTTEEPPIPVSLAAFQILQEGLTNALKHSDSRSILVQVNDEDGMVHIRVEDEGPGFDVEAEPSPHNMGLRLMRERADRVGGRLELHSAPGTGTRIEAVLPGRATR